MFPVNYDSEYLPTVPAHYNEAQTKEMLVNLLKQKAPRWAYEKEWRGIVDLDSCRLSGGTYFKDISDDDIVSVVIGCRSAVSPNYIRRSLNMNGWENVQVVRAHLSQKEYKIELNYESV